MKSFFLCMIIWSFFFFSSISALNAQQGYIAELLDIPKGVEAFDLETAVIRDMNFSDPTIQQTHAQLQHISNILVKEFTKQYRNGKISYYTMNDIVKSYKNFIYYSNQTFYYVRQRELGYNGKQLNRALKNSYSNMRLHYTRIQTLISKK